VGVTEKQGNNVVKTSKQAASTPLYMGVCVARDYYYPSYSNKHLDCITELLLPLQRSQRRQKAKANPEKLRNLNAADCLKL
jgi:hypothetical protein